MEYLYDDDCWLPAKTGPTHPSKSLIEAIKRGEVVWSEGALLHIKLPYHSGHLPNILGEEQTMIEELETHEQEDGSFISDPAPCDGTFEGVRHVGGKVLWSFRPNRLLSAGDVIALSSRIARRLTQ